MEASFGRVLRVPTGDHFRECGTRLAVADRPRISEKGIVVIEDHEFLARLCIREQVITRNVDDPACLHGKDRVPVGIDKREFLFHLEHLLFAP